MRRCAVIFMALLLTTTTVVLAHGNKKHIRGTVEKINAGSIVVKETSGKSVEVKIVPTTVFLKSGQLAKLEDLRVSERVVVHATPKGDTLEADQVKFGFAPGGAKLLPPEKKSSQQ